MEKRIKNESGDLLIRQSGGNGGCGIVEIVYLFDKVEDAGCTIGYWEVRKSDGEDIAEFQSVHDRIMTTEYDDAEVLLTALKFGQKLSDIIIDSNQLIK